MGWEAIGSMVEVVGALAVVLTLIFLAVQVRRNTRTIEDTRTQSMLELMIKSRTDLAQGRVAEIQVKVDGEEELTPAEELRYRAYRAEALGMWETYHLTSRAGKINPEFDAVMRARLRFGLVGESPAARKNRAIWNGTKSQYSQKFGDYVDELIARQ